MNRFAGLSCYIYLKSWTSRGNWMTQLVKCLTLNFNSGHDLAVCEIKPHICAIRTENAWDSLSFSLSLSAPPPLILSLSLSLKINIKKIKKIESWTSNQLFLKKRTFSAILLIVPAQSCNS